MQSLRNALCLLVSLVCICQATVPSVTRRFSAAQVDPGGFVSVTLEVSLPEEGVLPHVWLLTESWPAGWQVQDAKWNGQPYPPTAISDTSVHGWLFGDEEAPPVSAGTMTYVLMAPAELSSSATMNTADGAVFSYNDSQTVAGVETLRADIASQVRRFTMAIRPGWSLMALPYELDAVSRKTLEGVGDAMACLDGEELSFVLNGLPPMGMPFWIHNPYDEVLFCEFAAGTVENSPEPLCAAGPVRHQQWNLFGVCGDDPVRLATGVVAWRWQSGGYERCGENAILQPGEAVWIFVE